ncbi:MAG: MerR family transcriptional regulator [Bacteroidota bacterium]|jgi:DNA-binding transcriptional MerR regulator
MSEGSQEKLYYTISEVAEMFSVNASLIRFWEKEFEILKPHKNKKGNRLFTKKDIENIRLIYHFVKEKGYTLQGAKEKLKTDRSIATRNTEVIDTLSRMKLFLSALKAELEHED